MKISFPPSEKKIYDEFIKLYHPYVLTGTGTSNTREFKQEKSNQCRFCQDPNTTFLQKPHVIPKVLGSSNYFSLSECDKCNALFGTYENALAKYLGINTALSPFNSTKSFESGNCNIVFRKINESYSIERRNTNKPDLKYIHRDNKIVLDVSTPSYKPYFVYNALLKIALSVIRNDDVEDYKGAFKFLRDQNSSNLFPEMKHLKISETEWYYQYPFAMLFKRNDGVSSNFPLHTLCLYFHNRMFQIYFPLHTENWQKKYNDLELTPAPYVFLDCDLPPNGSVSRYSDDLSSVESVIREEFITLQLDPEALNNLVAYDFKNKTFQSVKLKQDDPED